MPGCAGVHGQLRFVHCLSAARNADQNTVRRRNVETLTERSSIRFGSGRLLDDGMFIGFGLAVLSWDWRDGGQIMLMHFAHRAMRIRKHLLPLALAMLVSSCAMGNDSSRRSKDSSPGFRALTDFSAFLRTTNRTTGEVVLDSGWIRASFAWDELVVSWNAQTPIGTGLKFEARAMIQKRATKFYGLGLWADDTAEQRRESVVGQKDEDGDVLTDTLVLRQPTDQMRPAANGSLPTLKLVGLSFLNRNARVAPQPPLKEAWGKSLPVPERSQLSYPGGRDWCSPTSVSMVLSYWARRLNRPELDVDVPGVAAGVFDVNWPGTGNWPFNTAFAGRFPGMQGFVTRLSDIAELEALVVDGVPPIISVSYDVLHGRATDQGNGHLVVVVGFTENGDPIVNDPWARFEKGDKVRLVVPRANLVRAWAHSRRTVYLIRPEAWLVRQ